MIAAACVCWGMGRVEFTLSLPFHSTKSHVPAPHQRILSLLSKDVWIAKSFLNQNICAGPSDISKKFPIINHTFASHLDSLRTGVYSAVQALRTGVQCTVACSTTSVSW